MPVIVNPIDSKVRIRFITGVDTEGNDVYKTKTYSNIKGNASDEDVNEIVKDIVGLQRYAKAAVIRVDERELLDE